MEHNFKIGDKVFVHNFDWGVITQVDDFHCKIKFKHDEKEIMYNFISFTEYTLLSFSQKRPENLPYIGKWGLFNSKNVKSSVISKLSEITDFHHISEEGGVYDYFTPLTEEQLKALNLKNE